MLSRLFIAVKPLLAIALLWAVSLPVSAKEPFIKIGILNHSGQSESEMINAWTPFVDYLAMKLPGYDFDIVPLGYYEVEAVVSNQQVDFVIANQAILSNLQAQSLVVPMSKLNTMIDEEIIDQYGGVIFSRRDSPIQSLADIQNKTLVAINEHALGGFLAAAETLAESGVDPFGENLELEFVDSPRSVVDAVLADANKVGTLRTGFFEQLVRMRVITEDDFTIINPQNVDYPLLLSTRLYPEWAFARLSHVESQLADELTLFLLRMQSSFLPTYATGEVSWSLPSDNSSVDELLKRFNLPPFAKPPAVTLGSFLARYWYWVLLGILLTFSSMAIAIALIRRNKRLERAKQRLERQNALILSSVADGIYGVDTRGRCTFVNQSMTKMTGWKQADLIGKNLQPLLHHSKRDGSPASIEECPMYASFKDNQAHYVSEDVFWTYDQEPMSVEYSSTPIRDIQGDVIGGVVVFRDITERKEAQEKLANHQTQLAHVARLSLLGEMASGIAHELNQPLTAIAMNAQACVRMLDAHNPDIDECADILETIGGQAERAGSVITQIRHLAHKELPEMQAVSLDVVIENVNSFMQKDFQRHDIRFHIDGLSDEVFVVAQQIQLEQVLLNLLRNASDALLDIPPEDRTLKLIIEKSGDKHIRIAVADNGPGIAESLQKELFNPFITTKSSGLGLGLSISQGIIEAHGSRISVSSEPRDTVFSFELPIHH